MSSIDEIMKLLEVNLCKACKMKTQTRIDEQIEPGTLVWFDGVLCEDRFVILDTISLSIRRGWIKVSFLPPIPASEISDKIVKECETCCICISQLEKGCIVTECPQCHGSIHNECLMKWLGASVNSACPLCKFDYKEHFLNTNYLIRYMYKNRPRYAY